jgi:hypothetical protein
MKKDTDTTSERENEVEHMAEEKTDKIIELLEEILKWVRLEGAQRAKDTLTGLLKTNAEKLVYENSDGSTSREIAQVVGTSHATVVNYWKKWARYGIVKEKGSRGGTRFLKVFSLADFGIEVPRISAGDKTVENESARASLGGVTKDDLVETMEAHEEKSSEEVPK